MEERGTRTFIPGLAGMSFANCLITHCLLCILIPFAVTFQFVCYYSFSFLSFTLIRTDNIAEDSYIFPFNPNPNWSQCYAKGPEIQQYILDTVEKFQLREKIQFNTKLTSAIWNESEGKWELKLQRGDEVLADKADIILDGSGVLKYVQHFSYLCCTILIFAVTGLSPTSKASTPSRANSSTQQNGTISHSIPSKCRLTDQGPGLQLGKQKGRRHRQRLVCTAGCASPPAKSRQGDKLHQERNMGLRESGR